MVGVAGSNPVVSTRIYTSLIFKGMPKNAANSHHDRMYFPPGLGLSASFRRMQQKQLRLLFLCLSSKPVRPEQREGFDTQQSNPSLRSG